MRRRANSFRANSRQQPRSPQARLIVTALIEHDEHLLLVQLARGRFAGFWLLPSATVESTIEETLRQQIPERTGYPVIAQRLLSVIEERRVDVHAVRFVFHTQVGDSQGQPADSEIARVHWFSRATACTVLAERDVVPTLAVMSLIRGWAEGISLAPLESLREDVLCPCGSGFNYPGCCGWDAG